jgi:hypothetical protein
MMRDIIMAHITSWERRARSETFLDEPLHAKAKAWLVEAVEAAVAEIDAARDAGADEPETTSQAPRRGKRRAA